MISRKTASLPTPVAVALAFVRFTALVLTAASGVWMNHAVEAGAIGLASNIAVAHKVCGIVFIIMAVTHVWTNRHRYAAMMAQPNSWRLHVDQRLWPINVALFLCVGISAIAIGFGSHSAVAFHSGCGLLLAVIGIFHFTLGRKR